MKILALTGGIASGKSAAAEIFAAEEPRGLRFDADASARRLLAEDQELVEKVVARFGPDCLGPDGAGVDRAVLRAKVFSDPAGRKELEGWVHPRVREECLAVLESARTLAAPWFLAEIPLLFEGGFHLGQDLNLTVAVTRQTQLSRLQARNGFDRPMSEAILAAQLPMEEKILRAEVVLWNEGPLTGLTAQIRRFLKTISR